MRDPEIRLSTLFGGWERSQRHLVNAIAYLSSEQLAVPTAPHHWTIGKVAQHLVADRVFWFHEWMGEGSAELAPLAQWDPGVTTPAPVIPAEELVAGFESTWTMIAQALDRWTLADLGHVFPPPLSLSEADREAFGEERTVQWIVWHVHEHEIHHGGELSLALGSLGVQGVYDDA